MDKKTVIWVIVIIIILVLAFIFFRASLQTDTQKESETSDTDGVGEEPKNLDTTDSIFEEIDETLGFIE